MFFPQQSTSNSLSTEIDRNFEELNDDSSEGGEDDIDQTTQTSILSTPTVVGPFSNTTIRPFVPNSTIRPTKLDELTVQRKKVVEQQKLLKPTRVTPNDLSTRVTPNDLSTDESLTSQGAVSIVETTLCDCPEIEVTSQVIYHSWGPFINRQSPVKTPDIKTSK